MPAVGSGIVNIKGGVGNHDLLSTTHPDTTPAAVTRGGIVIGVGVSPKWELVTIGGANTVLHSDGTDATWATLVKADLPSTVVHTDQANVYGDFDQSFRSNRLRIANPTNTFFYSFTAAAIGANQVITLPLLTAGDTMVTEAFAQTITNKTINATNNTITNITNTELATGVFGAITGVGVQTQPLDMNGNDIILDAAGNIRIDNSVANVTKLKHSTNFPNFGLLRDQIVPDGSTAGKFSFRSKDSSGNERVFGEIKTIIEDTTVAGNLVHGSFHIRVMDANVETPYMSFNDAKSGQINVLKKATFNPNATDPGLNFGSQAGDPNTLVNGDTWYNSTTNKFRAREAGASVDMIGGVTSMSTFNFPTQTDADSIWRTTQTAIARVNITLNRLEHNQEPADANNNAIAFDFGSALSDTAWVIRFRLNVRVMTLRTINDARCYIGMYSADQNTDGRTAQDCIVLQTRASSSGILGIVDTDGTAPQGTVADATFAHAYQVETIWVEIKRLTATTYSIEIFSDAFTTSIELENGTVASTTIGLRYFKLQDDPFADATADNVLDIDDFQFRDGNSTFA